jgi:sugar/nucleoside kinase (ribokinase family)
VEAPTGKRAIINARGNTPPPTITPALVELLQSCTVLHITGTYAETVLKAISIVSKKGGKISFDGGAGLFREDDREIINKVDWCICAEDYARRLTGMDDIPSMLASIAAMGPEIVGITAGTLGSDWLIENESLFHQNAFPVTPVVDTTGCGDSFHGAFIFAMLNDYTVQEATRLASAVAAMNAMVLGGRAGLPDMKAVNQFIHSL